METQARLALTSALLVVCIMLVACDGGGDDANSQSSTSTSTALPTTPGATPTAGASVKDEVSAAYLHYWNVYANAVYNLDPSRLGDLMTGPRLDRALAEVRDLKHQGRAVKIVVENRPVVVHVEDTRAVVSDEYENRSHFIDPDTKQPLTSPSGGEVIHDQVTLALVDGIWKVFDSVREAQ